MILLLIMVNAIIIAVIIITQFAFIGLNLQFIG